MKEAVRRIIRSMLLEPDVRTIVEQEFSRLPEKLHICEYCECEQGIPEGFSRVTIEHDCRIVFNDRGNTVLHIEGYQARALYMFYLISPHAVAYGELHRYKEVLMDIYQVVCKHKTSDRYRSEMVINGLLERKGGISDANHKIKKGVLNAFGSDDLTNMYLITGKKNGKKFIPCDKNLIIINNDVIRKIACSI